MNLKYLLNYVRTMKCYFYFLILQLLVVIALIIYVFLDFGKNHKKTHVFAIECGLTLVIFCEVLLRMFLNKREFFDNVWNIVDVVGIIIITGLFFGFVFVEAKRGVDLSEQNDAIPAILLAARYIMQVFRIVLTLKQSRDIQTVANDHIVFNDAVNKSEENHQSDDMSIRV